MNSLIITTEHLRAIDGYCVAGAREFARLHAINFKQFIQNGIAADELIKTGDALALRIVELAAIYEAQKEEASDGQ